jgi:hypothetical protein
MTGNAGQQLQFCCVSLVDWSKTKEEWSHHFKNERNDCAHLPMADPACDINTGVEE